jgi:hypothetical protein
MKEKIKNPPKKYLKRKKLFFKRKKKKFYKLMYQSMMPHDLQRHAFTGLVNKVGLDKSTVDYICAGTVIQVGVSHVLLRNRTCC